MKLGWKKEDLIEDKKHLKNLLESTSDSVHKAEIAKVYDSLCQSIESKYGPVPHFRPSLNYLLTVATEDHPIYDRYYSIIKQFFLTFNQLIDEINTTSFILDKLTGKELDFANLTGCKFTDEKAICIARDFIINLDKNIGADFSYIFESEKYNISFAKLYGSPNGVTQSVATSNFVPYANSFYVSVNSEESLSKVANLVHEFGHTLNYFYNPSVLYGNNKNFTDEVAAIFPEILFLLDNFDKGDCIEAQFELFKMLSTFYELSNNIIYRKVVAEIWKKCDCKTNLIFFKNVKNELLFPLHSLKNLLSFNFYDSGVYIISCEVALELAYIYLFENNKEKALDIYKKIIKNQTVDELAIIYGELELGEHTLDMLKFIISKTNKAIKEYEKNENMGLRLSK